MTRDLRRSRAATARLLVVFIAGALVGCARASPGPPEPAEPIPAGPLPPAFTSEQATRGQRVYTSVCSTCHGRNEFAGPIFEITWRAEPLSSLFEHVSTNMPQDRPGSLTSQQYIDVVAYILQLNGIQPGTQELVADMAQLARIEW
jgi:mono/diheme cytochrome c family protein